MPTKQKTSAKSAPAIKRAKSNRTITPVKPVVPVKQEVAEKPVKQKKVYEISAFFHALIVVLVVILYAEIALLTVIYFNYDISIEKKSSYFPPYYQTCAKRPRLHRISNTEVQIP